MHEPVAEVIDAVVIDGQEIPRLILQNPGSGVVDGTVLGQDLGERHQTLVLLLIDFGRARNPGKDGGLGNVTGMHAQLGESIAQTFRMDRARWQRPRLILRRGSVRIKIGNRDAVNRLRRMTSKPAEDVGFVAALGENIPDRFDLARGAGDRPNPAVLRVRLHESVNAVLVRRACRWRWNSTASEKESAARVARFPITPWLMKSSSVGINP